MSARLTKAEKERREKQHEREVLVSKAKLVLIVLCMIAIPVTFFWNHIEIGGVGDRVTRIESPCQQFGSQSKVCEEAFETAVKSITHRIACYIDRKAGRPFKPSCRGVELRIEENKPAYTAPHNAPADKAPSEVQVVPNSGIGDGGDASNPTNTGHSQPAPGNGGSHQGGSGGSGGGSAPAPSPVVPTQPSSSSDSSSSSSSEPSAPPAEPPAATPSTPPAEHPIAEGVGSTVEGAGSAVTETLEGVNGVLCGTTGALGLPC